MAVSEQSTPVDSVNEIFRDFLTILVGFLSSMWVFR